MKIRVLTYRSTVVGALALCGCASNPLTAAYDARDDAFCRQIGAMPGTQMYYDCRLQRTHDRALVQAGARASVSPANSGPDAFQMGLGAGLPPTPQAGIANGQSCLGYTIQTQFGPKFVCQ